MGYPPDVHLHILSGLKTTRNGRLRSPFQTADPWQQKRTEKCPKLSSSSPQRIVSGKTRIRALVNWIALSDHRRLIVHNISACVNATASHNSSGFPSCASETILMQFSHFQFSKNHEQVPLSNQVIRHHYRPEKGGYGQSIQTVE